MRERAIPIEILLVEDNLGDVALTREALAAGRVANSLTVVRDGEAALAYLRGLPPHQGRPRPDMVLLDLNLPRRSGREVLQEMKADPALRKLPVVILTASRDEVDIVQTYDLHANCYIVKPVDLEQFIRVVQAIEDFWFTIVRLPPPSPPG